MKAELLSYYLSISIKVQSFPLYQQQQLPKDVELFTTISCKHSIKLAVINKKDEQPYAYELTEEVLSEKGLVALNDILKPDEDGKPVQYVLIDGARGMHWQEHSGMGAVS